jgi:organic hydroperoxide reductase OsmC/OhrA
MSQHTAKVEWILKINENFLKNQYSRGHLWHFDGGISVPASAAPSVVPLPFSVAENVDPEEAFVAAISSCHMLFFLSIAAKKKFIVQQYTDKAVGVMEENEAGKIAMTRVTLRPKVIFSGDNTPTFSQLEKIHHLSHENCFIANSVTTIINTEIVL